MALRWKFFLCLLVLVVCYFSFYRNIKNNKTEFDDKKFGKTLINVDDSLLGDEKHWSGSEMQVFFIFSKAENNSRLQNSFVVTVSSLLKFVSNKIRFHIVGDEFSRKRAEEILKPLTKQSNVFSYETYDIDDLAKKIENRFNANFLSHFRHSVGAYYGDSLFFLSLILHEFKSFRHLKRVIKLDCDLKFMSDIRDLWNHFQYFNDHQLIGLVNEQTPVYRHVFSSFRNQNKGTKIGDPLPDGHPGFNSGVILIELEKIRKNSEYKSLLTEIDTIENMTKKYIFKGHLGDQDVYTLLSTEYSKFFFRLPCQWNRQLCTWWKSHGYADVFHKYNHCDNKIKIYHGNCNSPFLND